MRDVLGKETDRLFCRGEEGGEGGTCVCLVLVK